MTSGLDDQLGSLLFALCAVPEAIKVFRAKTGHYSWWFLGMWGGAELLMINYVIRTSQWTLLGNYIANLLCLAVLVYYNRRKQ